MGALLPHTKAHPKPGSARREEVLVHPYRDFAFCSCRVGAGLCVITAGLGVGSMVLIPDRVIEVCVVIQATAMDLRRREKKGWGEHPSGLPPGVQAWTPLPRGGCYPAQPWCSMAFLFCPYSSIHSSPPRHGTTGFQPGKLMGGDSSAHAGS